MDAELYQSKFTLAQGIIPQKDSASNLGECSFKRCSKCKTEKQLTEFGKNKKGRDGFHRQCKKCKAEYWKQYLRSNLRFYKKARDRSEQWRKNNLARFRNVNKKWKKNNPDKVIEMRKRYDKKLHSTLEGRLLARERRQLSSIQQRSTPQQKLNKKMSYQIWKSLRKNKARRSWKTLVEYTLEDLRRHLESKFTAGMTWENFGKWHIDHAVPVTRFKYDSPDNPEFKKCWSLNNLQPLWKHDNLSKSSKTMDEWIKSKEGIV